MTRPSRSSQTSALALAAGRPAPTARAADAMGQAGSREALSRLNAALGELKALSVQPILSRAVAALQAEDHETGARLAIQALEKDERNGFGWYRWGIESSL